MCEHLCMMTFLHSEKIAKKSTIIGSHIYVLPMVNHLGNSWSHQKCYVRYTERKVAEGLPRSLTNLMTAKWCLLVRL